MKIMKWVWMPNAVSGEWVEVRVMAQAEGYAMVRRKGCIPFIVRSSVLHEKDAAASPDKEALGGKKDA